MSKKKAIFKYAQAAVGVAGAIGTVTGTGTLHVIAHAVGIHISPTISFRLAVKQYENASRKFQEGNDEWKRNKKN